MLNKSTKIFLLLILTLFLSVGAADASTTYATDVVIGKTDGIWTDSRSFSSLTAAVTNIGALERDLYIAKSESVTDLTVPSNIRLHFVKSGAINNTGQLTLQTTQIFAGDQQIFTGAGDIDFAAGTVVRSSWFSNLDETLDVTSDDTITVLISGSETMTADSAVGNDVILRWESPFIISTATPYTLSNVKNIEAGTFQIFAGDGDIDFLAGSVVRSSWFPSFNYASVVTSDENSDLTILVDQPETVAVSSTLDEYQDLEIKNGCILTISAGQVLTINGYMKAGLYQIFTGTGTVTLGRGFPRYPEWWGAASGNADDTAEVQAALNTRGKVILSEEYMVSGVYIRPGTHLTGTAIHTAASSYINVGLKLINSSNPEGVLMTENVETGFAGDWNMHAIFIENIAIDGNRDNNTAGHGIYQVTSGFINKISNVKIRECSDDGIHLGGEGTAYADKAVIFNVSISGCDGRGIYVDGDTGSTAILLESIKVDDCLRGIYFSGGTGKRLQGVSIINYRSEVSLADVTIMASSIEFNAYTGTAIVQNAKFFKADAPATRTGGAIKITGNGPRLVLMGISQNLDSDDGHPAYTYIYEDTDEVITIADETITFFAAPPTADEIGNIVARRFDYYYKAGDDGFGIYLFGEDYPRTRFISNNIYFGDGAADPDIDFYRDAANSWAFGLVANVQKTSVRMKTTELTMNGATETWATAIPAGSLVLGVTGRVTSVITGATTFDVGISGGDTDLFADGVAVAEDTTFNLANSNAALVAPVIYQAETSILVTSQGGAFTAGTLRLTLHYVTLGAPIS